MQQGVETGKFGSCLAAQIRKDSAYSGWHVYYDHGDAALDMSIDAIRGFFGTEVRNLNRVADMTGD